MTSKIDRFIVILENKYMFHKLIEKAVVIFCFYLEYKNTWYIFGAIVEKCKQKLAYGIQSIT